MQVSKNGEAGDLHSQSPLKNLSGYLSLKTNCVSNRSYSNIINIRFGLSALPPEKTATKKVCRRKDKVLPFWHRRRIVEVISGKKVMVPRKQIISVILRKGVEGFGIALSGSLLEHRNNDCPAKKFVKNCFSSRHRSIDGWFGESNLTMVILKYSPFAALAIEIFQPSSPPPQSFNPVQG